MKKCKICGKELNKKQKNFCSRNCLYEWMKGDNNVMKRPVLREKMRQSNLKNPRRYWFGKKRNCPWITERQKDKSYEEIWGIEKASEIIMKQSNRRKGHICNEETRQKIRESNIRYIEKFCGDVKPNKGKNETLFLNFFEELFGYKILRQYRVCGYFLDGYIPELNLAIEIDEPWHRKQKEKDIIRQQNIERKLNCQFVRMKDFIQYQQ